MGVVVQSAANLWPVRSAEPRIIARRTRWLLAGVTFLAQASVLLAPSTPALAQALPTGGTVTAGSAAIAQPGAGALVITQSSANAIINWSSFSIGQGGSVRFENGAGATLNRVTGFTRSQIDGSLSASGSLYLVNPNGITVGPTGTVTTGGRFIASTHDVADADFLAGRDLTFRGSSTASVINYGQIGSLGGDVALIARKVENAGTLSAPEGTAALAAGYEVLVRDTALSNGKFVVKVGGADTEVKTSGVIKAAEAELRASGGNVYALAGNTESLTKATGVANKGGRVFLTAGDGGTVTVSQKVVARGAESGGKAAGGEIRVSAGKVSVSGKLDASGTADAAGAWAKGGTIIVTGRDIALAGGADLDASGASGGVVLVGGDYQGGATADSKTVSEAVDTAQTVSVDTGASLRADGREGAGGKVVVWSDSTTRFAGAISATGTTTGGDAEVSGKGVLDYAGTADLRGAAGRFGTLLLDPYNLTISTGTDSNVSDFTATGDDSVLNVTTLTNALATANVTVSTGSDGSQAGNITVAAPITWSADSVLTLAAAGNVIVNSAITATGTNAGLVIQYGVGMGYSVNAPITLSGFAPTLEIGAAGALSSYTLLRSMDDIKSIESNGRSGKYALVVDVDADGTTYTQSVVSGFFTGTFAGLGHTISNLNIDASGSNYVGLFAIGDFASGNTIQDLTLAGGKVTGNSIVGSLLGALNTGTIQNVHTSVSVEGDNTVGGLVGNGYGGAIVGSSASGSVTAQGGGWAGGLIGSSNASITSSFATGDVSGNGSYVGGLAGSQAADVTDSHATGAVTNSGYGTGGLLGSGAVTVTSSYATGSVTGANATGGLIGESQATVTSSYATGSVAGAVDAGGLVGSNSGNISSSYATGSVTGTYNVGGLAGSSYGAISTAYATGGVSGEDYVGGLVGSAGYNVTQSYASGAVSATGTSVGGLIGTRSYGTVSASYWDKGSTGQTVGIGDDTTNTGVVGLTSTQARQSSSYVDWDFTTTWYQSGDMRPIGVWEAAPVVDGVATITNAHQLQLIKLNLAGTYVLGTDIDLSATASTATSSGIWGASGFQSIGNGTTPFTGSLDGQGRTISNLTTKITGGNYAGLFGYADTGAILQNMTLQGGSVSGTYFYFGGLVGYNKGTITSVVSSVAVSGSNYSGGIAGYNSGTISNSSASGRVKGWQSGGLVGYNAGTISSSHASGDVGLSTDNTVGGLVGTNYGGTLTDVYATGTVTASSPVGGLVGQVVSTSVITNAYATGAVSGGWTEAGGLVGSMSGGTITNAYATGSVTLNSQTSTAYAGGLVGQATSVTLTNVYASGAVSVTTASSGVSYAGGLIGKASSTSITDAYAIGSTLANNAGTAYAGGVVGYNADGSLTRVYSSGAVTSTGGNKWSGGVYGYRDSGTASAVYWDKDSSGRSNGAGNNYPDGLTGLTSAEARQSSSYDGWDFTTTWYQTGDMRPIGRWEAAPVVDGVATITNAHQLQLVNANLSGTYVLGADIDLAATNSTQTSSGIWGASGFQSIGSNGTPFTGSLDGQGHIISNLTINAPSSSSKGLFGVVSGNATDPVIQNLTLSGGSVTGKYYVGALVGEMQSGVVSNVHSSVDVTGHDAVGGLVGAADVITASSASGNVSGHAQLGGLAGYAGGAITSSYATGSVTATTYVVGGLVGESYGTVTSSYAIGAVSGTWGVGGLIGLSYGDVTSSYATGSVTASNDQAGGLVGYNGSTISQSFASGAVSGRKQVGGLVGQNDSSASVTQSFASGNVSGTETAGGFVGLNAGGITQSYATGSATVTTGSVGGFVGSNTGTISESYSTGLVTNGVNYGGFAGVNSGTISSSYWDTQTSGQASSAGGTGLTTAQMHDWSSYQGWDWHVWAPATATSLPLLYGVSGVIGVVQTGTYGDNPAAAVVSYLGTNAWNTTSGTPTTTLSTSTNAGISYTTVTGMSGTYAAGGSTTFVGVADIAQRAITVTANGQARAYGNANPTSGAVSVGGDGLANSDTISSATVVSSATGTSNVSSYNLLASDAVFSSGAASNYAITYLDNATGLSVTPRAITVTADGQSRIYGNANPTSGEVSVGGDGLANSDTISSATVVSSATGTSNVGSYNLLASDAVFSTGAASNYAITYVDNVTGLSVTQRAITVTADGQARAYGNANPTSGAVSVGGAGLANSDTISSATVVSSATGTSNVGSYNLLASDAVFSTGAASNYAITYLNNASGLSVTQRAITVTADGQSRAYGNANPTSGAVIVGGAGMANTDAISSATVVSSATGTSNVGSYNLLASDAVFSSGAASNYAITYLDNASGLSVTQRAITVTANGQSRIYGNANPTSGAVSVGGDGLVNGNTISGATVASSATGTSNVGSYNLLASDAVFSSGAASNYAITYLNNASGLSVTQRAITVTADGQSRAYGNANPTSGAVIVGGAGMANTDAISSATVVSSATGTSNVGSYNLLASDAVFSSGAASNYAITYLDNASGLSVIQRAITVTADGQSRVYGNANPTSGAVSVGGDGLVNGNTISGATVASSATGTSNVGSYNLLASDAVFSSGAASNYAITYLNNASGLSVTQRAITVTADGQSRAYGNANPTSGAVSVGGDGLVNSDAISSATLASSATGTSNVGSYNLLASDAVFSSGAASNYAITYLNNASGLAVTQRAITVTADNQQRPTGQSNPPLTYQISGSGLVNGDTLSGELETSATAASPAGAYDITQGTVAASANYALDYVPGVLTVTGVSPAAIIVVSVADQPTYVQTSPIDVPWVVFDTAPTQPVQGFSRAGTSVLTYGRWLSMSGN